VGLTLFLIIMKITIIFDNTAYDPTLQPSWGFSALIEINEKKSSLIPETMEIFFYQT